MRSHLARPIGRTLLGPPVSSVLREMLRVREKPGVLNVAEAAGYAGGSLVTTG